MVSHEDFGASREPRTEIFRGCRDVVKNHCVLFFLATRIWSSKMSNSIGTKQSPGPRTAVGKQRVKLNALKHGIFAEIVFQGGKFQAPVELFDDLVDELRNTIRPTNGLEFILVDQLAITLFRLSRVYQADSEVAPLFFEKLKESTHDGSTSIVTAAIEKEDEVAFFHRGPSLEVLVRYEAGLFRQVGKILDQIEQVRRIGSGSAANTSKGQHPE